MSDSYHHEEDTVTNNNYDEYDDLDCYPRQDRLEALCIKHYTDYTH